MIVAHRGASRDAPENTCRAFMLAWAQGADAVEGDFRLTRDREIICRHDPDIGNRPIAEQTLEAIRRIEPDVPTLSEVLATVPAGKAVFLEIKCGPEITPVLMEQLNASALNPDQVTVIAFNPEVIRSVKTANPAISAHWLLKFRRPFPFRLKPSMPEVLQTLEKIRADGLSTHPQFLTRRIVQRLNRAGCSHHVWTVDDPAAARRFLSWGTRSITTNLPGKLKKQLESSP
ncbi:glycerophosphodiester phosphodiesterase family protein [Pontiella sp.]|uniref:glycerophosphodiester phosphodiesterase family protein n=1 Tax=Pontiella sp. TaxID=2837462 RepID=UPI003563C989